MWELHYRQQHGETLQLGSGRWSRYWRLVSVGKLLASHLTLLSGRLPPLCISTVQSIDTPFFMSILHAIETPNCTHIYYSTQSCLSTVLHLYLRETSLYIFKVQCIERESRDSAVGIATGYRLDVRGVGVRVPIGSRIFSFPRRQDRLWGPPSLLFMGTGGYFPWGKAAETRSWPLTSN
jgi:hypothetical protein